MIASGHGPGSWPASNATLAEPGDYFVFDIARESILVSRTQAGALAAFYNVCQHRGARVVVNDRGWVQNFVCPYHGWTYGWDGHLDHLPDPERFAPPGRLRGPLAETRARSTPSAGSSGSA